MRNCKLFVLLLAVLLIFSLPCTTAYALDYSSLEAKGYLWDPGSNELKKYYTSPEECLPALPDIETLPTAESHQSTDTPSDSVRGFARHFHSFIPGTYEYDYDNALFEVGMVRIDNSHNLYSSASIVFAVEQAGSCSATVTVGTTYGGKIDAIYAKMKAEVHAEIATTVTWSSGTSIQTEASVPPGQIGRITAYVVGIVCGGTARYTVENTATNTLRYEDKTIGVLFPTTMEWNLVVEIPSDESPLYFAKAGKDWCK